MFPEELGYYPYAFIGAAIGITAAWAKGLNPYLATFAGAALGPLAILFFLASPDVPKKTSIAEARAKWERTPLGKWLYLTVIIVITFSALTFFSI